MILLEENVELPSEGFWGRQRFLRQDQNQKALIIRKKLVNWATTKLFCINYTATCHHVPK